MDTSLFFIFISACLINNFVLTSFLGICSFVGVSNKVDTALRMGAAVTFVMLISSISAFLVHKALLYFNTTYLELIAFIVVIASVVQIVEMVIKKYSPALFRTLGIFLPLITTNCAVLAVALLQTKNNYSFLECIVFALGAGLGYTLALLIMSGLREDLDLADVPKLLKGAGLTLLVAAIISLSFMGFAGLGGQ